jgi:hypothetical protein
MQKPADKRIGPWRYTAQYDVLDKETWTRPGEVIYFVVDADQRLRLVGQSMSKLNGRWKTVPMFDIVSHKPLGRKALFHTSSWPAIEAGLELGEHPSFTVSALFRDELEPICKAEAGFLSRIINGSSPVVVFDVENR